MKKVMIGLLLASAAVASPAQARDGTWYAGIEAGAMWAKDLQGDYSPYDYSVVGRTSATTATTTLYTGTLNFDSEIDHSTGTDADLIAGYDFGMFRAELELGYKHATHERYGITADEPVPDYDAIAANLLLPLPPLPLLPGQVFQPQFYDLDSTSEGYGKTDVYSAMVNLLFDIGNEDGFSFYAGPGVGLASTRIKVKDRAFSESYSIKDSGIALQGIAGVRYAISTNLDIGLKYRYFHGNKMSDDFDLDIDNDSVDDSQNIDIDVSRFKSHSLLASLVYNFASPPPPPPVVVAPAPMPEPAPQMQTCWDGSMIPVTAVCPAQPAPVVPAPQPGERG